MKLKFKLTKTSGLLVTAGLCFVASVVLSLICSQQVQQQGQLKAKLTSTQFNLKKINLEQLSTQQVDLEKQLSQATSQFESVKAISSPGTGSTAAISAFFKVAKDNGLEVTEMTSPGPAKDTIEGVNCSALLLNAKVEGNISNLVGFITKLNSALVTSAIKSATITTPGVASGENASADIQLVIYNFGGN